MTGALPSLEVNGVTAGYGASDILHAVTIKVAGGVITTVAGPNGAGKSTLVKTIAGLLKPSRGAILIDGRDVTGLSPPQRALAGLGYVPQERNVFRNLSIGENLKIGFEFVRKGAGPYVSARDHVLSLFPDLSGRLNDVAGTLSGGQRQMLAIGCALMAAPRVLLLDEPSAGLSPRYVHEMLEAVRAVNASGVTVLMVEQNLVEAVRISHDVVLLAGGKVQGGWPASKFLGDPAVQRMFLGRRHGDDAFGGGACPVETEPEYHGASAA